MVGWYKFTATGLIQVEDPDAGVGLISNCFGGHGDIIRHLRVDCGGIVEVGYEENEYEGNEK